MNKKITTPPTPPTENRAPSDPRRESTRFKTTAFFAQFKAESVACDPQAVENLRELRGVRFESRRRDGASLGMSTIIQKQRFLLCNNEMKKKKIE